MTRRNSSSPVRSAVLAVVALLMASHVLLPPVGRPASAGVLPAGLRDVTVLSGLSTPTALRFAPDGRLFVAEKRGTVKVFSDVTDRAPRTVVDLSAQVYDYGDRGLLGLAVPPDLVADPAIYVLYAVDALPGGTSPHWNDVCPTPPGADTDGCLVSGRLSRLPLTGDVAGAEQVLLEGWCQQFSSHSVGALAFDRAGALLVSGGDGASFTGVDYGQFGGSHPGGRPNPCGDPPGGEGTALTAPTAEGGSLRSQSLGRAGGPVLLNGSVLRLDPRTGAAAKDNPFAGASDAHRARTIATGLRNPFRFTVRPGTDEVWIGDVGWNHTEEINRIGSTTDAVVENFGWPCYEGSAPQPGYDAAGLHACERLYAAPTAVTSPHYDFPHSAVVVPDDGCPPGGSSVSGTAFNTGSRYPARYAGALFFADYSRNCIWAMALGAGSDPDPSSISVVASRAAGPIDLQTGPDGWLYYVGVFDGGIHRIETVEAPPEPPPGTRYVSALPRSDRLNGWGPVEVDASNGDLAAGDGRPLTVEGTVFARGLGVHAVSEVDVPVPEGCTSFDASVGVDDEVGPYGSVVFRVLRDGVQAWQSPVLTGAAGAVRVSVPLSGVQTLGLRVDDGGDGIGYDHADWGDARLTCASTQPPPGSEPPVVTITSPAAPAPWAVGDRISFAGSATGRGGAALDPSAMTWVLDHHHCPGGVCHTHFIQRWTGVASGAFPTADIDYPGFYVLTAIAEDASGASGRASVRLDPRTVDLTFTTNPGGLKLAGLVLGSDLGTTPLTRTVIVGSAHTVSAPSPQRSKNKTYSFRSWSDGLPQNHTVVAPATSTTYTAVYRRR